MNREALVADLAAQEYTDDLPGREGAGGRLLGTWSQLKRYAEEGMLSAEELEFVAARRGELRPYSDNG